MSKPLSLLQRELEGTGFKTLKVPGQPIEASTKTDALRAIRTLQKLLSGNRVKGVSYAALYGIYELARLRSKGKTLSAGQKAAIALTFTQLKKIGLLKKLKGLFTFGKPDVNPEDDVKELQDWLVSPAGFGKEDEGSAEHVDQDEPEFVAPVKKRAAGWMPEEKRFELDVERYGEEEAGRRAEKRRNAGKGRRKNVATSSVDVDSVIAIAKALEVLIASHAARGVVATTIYGIYGLIKKYARTQRLDKFERSAIDDSFKFLCGSPKVNVKIKDKLSELHEDYTAVAG
jgi:hypothetical protein